MTKTLFIEFTLDNGKTSQLKLPSPREDITKSEVQAVATSIVNKKAVAYSGAYPVATKSMYVRTVEDAELE